MGDFSANFLCSQHCKPLRGSMNRLNNDDLNAALIGLKNWQVIDGELVRALTFPDYYHSIAFVNALAYIANAQDHHPDLSVHYNRVQVRFSTHDVGGLSMNDLICAAKVDALFAAADGNPTHVD
jgi:4a-hydroxytetrahydrobiopterin dehydratase